MQRVLLPCILLAVLALATVAPAQTGPARIEPGRRPAGPPPRAKDLVRVRLAAAPAAFAPGRTTEIAIVFDIAPRWHTYWENAGAGGGPPRISVTAPDGFTVGEPRFPRPVAYEEPAGRSFVYFGQSAVFVPITAPADAASGPVELTVDVSYLVCRDVCLLGRAKRTISVPLVPADAVRPKPVAEDRRTLERHRKRLPQPFATLSGARATHTDDTLVLTGPAGGHGVVEFFPLDMPGVSFDEPEIVVTDDRFRVTVPVEIRPHNALGETIVLRGVIGLGDDPDAPSYAISLSPRLEP